MIFRHFEQWTFNGEYFDIVELDATLNGWYNYPESFFVNDRFCN